MKIEMGKKYKTRDGKDVTILSTHVNGDAFKVLGLVHYGDIDHIETWTQNGAALITMATDFDLVEAKEKKEGWLNIYPPRSTGDEVASCSNMIFSTEAAANLCACADRIACIKVPFEV